MGSERPEKRREMPANLQTIDLHQPSAEAENAGVFSFEGSSCGPPVARGSVAVKRKCVSDVENRGYYSHSVGGQGGGS